MKQTWANGELYTLDYWDTGQIKKTFYPNNTWEDYTLTSRNFIQSVVSRKQVGPNIVDLFGHAYAYNELGDRKFVSIKIQNPTGPSTIGTVNYTYDALRRLTRALYSGINQNRDVNFSYDPVGNRMIRSQPDVTYTYNLSNNRLTTSSDGFSYSYDNNGNLTTKATLISSLNFSYDFENRNTKVRILPQPDSLVFKYSGLGSRIEKITKSGSVVDTTWYVYDGIYAVCEFSGSDSLKSSYVYANGLLLARTTPPVIIPGPNQYYHHDGLGSIVGMTDQFSNVSQTYLYDDFGVLIDSVGTVVNAYRYTGQEWDGGVSSLYNYRARYYDATIARFNQEDQIFQVGFSVLGINRCLSTWKSACGSLQPYFIYGQRLPQRMNLYPYVTNNPVNFTDPTGLKINWRCYTGCMFGCSIAALEPAGMICLAICSKLPPPANIYCALGCMIGGIGVLCHPLCVNLCEEKEKPRIPSIPEIKEPDLPGYKNPPSPNLPGYENPPTPGYQEPCKE